MSKKYRIGMIGNYMPGSPSCYSTECEREKAFVELGHTVRRFQENKTSSGDLLNEINRLDMLVYSHTHGYEIPNLKRVFEIYKEKGVPTVSAHLDLWRGLKRWEDVGEEATWHVQYIFTPDDTGIWPIDLNHHWLPPGVAKDQCYKAEPNRDKFPHEIVFTGSKGYHPEHWWRPKLIEWLHETYGDRFQHYGNDGQRVVREAELNELYSSSKIVIGDSCFSGRIKRYWSDRIPEVTGRNGFLIHPEVEGMTHKGIVTYKPEDFDDLKNKIDYYLEHDDEREKTRDGGFEWTKNNATYTHHAKTILKTVFGERNEN